MITIHGRATSLNVQKVMWAVGELDLAHERLDVGGRHGGTDTPAYLAMNPNRLVPTLVDDGAVVWESNTIVRYLAAKYGAGTLWAADAAERAVADQWMDWMQTTLAPDFYDLFWTIVRTPKAKQDPAAIARAAERVAAHYAVLDRWLAGRLFVAGERLTMGDVPAGATLHRYGALLDEAGLARPALPALAAWRERLMARPPYRRHVMVSYEELRAR